MTDPTNPGSSGRLRGVGRKGKSNSDSTGEFLKSAIKDGSSRDPIKSTKTVSFDATQMNNDASVLDESLELEDLPLDSTDREFESGADVEGEDYDDDDDGDDDLVIYNEADEGDNLTGSLSELSRRGTLDSEMSTPGASGSGRRVEIESLLLAPVDDFETSSEDSLLGNVGVTDSVASERERESTPQARATREPPPSGPIRTGVKEGESSHSAPESTYRRDAKHRNLSYGSPITLNQPAFRDAPSAGFSEIPLVVTQQGGPFDGLVYCDSVDALGRPIVVLNTSAIPHKSLRNQALAYVSQCLEPIVAQGPYVLVFASFKSEGLMKVPAAWAVGAYRKLSRPFKKNVEYVVLVRPNRILKGLLKVLSLVVKKKSRRKVKEITYLSDIASATNEEVGIQHLGPKVLASMGLDGLSRESGS